MNARSQLQTIFRYLRKKKRYQIIAEICRKLFFAPAFVFILCIFVRVNKIARGILDETADALRAATSLGHTRYARVRGMPPLRCCATRA